MRESLYKGICQERSRCNKSSMSVSGTFSDNLQEAATLYITYQLGGSAISYEQDHEIVEPLPNISLPAHANTSELRLQGKHPGLVYVGVDSSSQEFTE